MAGGVTSAASPNGGTVSSVMYLRAAHSSVLLDQGGADQAHDGGVVREDAHHVGAPLDLLVDALQRVGRVDLRAVFASILDWELPLPTGSPQVAKGSSPPWNPPQGVWS